VNPASTERLHALDAVRGFALLLGVALHGALSYLPGAKGFWIVADDSSLALAGLFYWIHLFRMTLFFLLAGFFGRLLLERLGLRAFVRDRLRRVTAVLACAWPLIFPAIVLVLVGATAVQHGGTLPPTPPPPPMDAHNFPLTHLWFLYVLSMFYALALLLRGIVRKLDRRGRAMARVDALARALAGPAAASVLALPAALALATAAKWPMWFGVPTPDMSLIPNRAAIVAFGTAFLAGWALQRQSSLLDSIASRWPLHLGLASLATAACFVQLGGFASPTTPAEGIAQWGFAATYAIAGWAWTLALLGLALRFLGDHSPARRYLADASYWIYLVHLPLAMAAQVVASRFDAPWFVEYPLVLAAVLGVALVSYRLCVRHTWIGSWLNGRRVARASTHATAEAGPRPAPG
jgi:peptidoglycan/LPS O-acetylase OafA/YrhL